MAFRTNLPLLGDFTLEPMSLRTFERQAWIRLVDLGAEGSRGDSSPSRRHGDQSNTIDSRRASRKAPPSCRRRSPRRESRSLNSPIDRSGMLRSETGSPLWKDGSSRRHLSADQAGARLLEASDSGPEERKYPSAELAAPSIAGTALSATPRPAGTIDIFAREFLVPSRAQA